MSGLPHYWPVIARWQFAMKARLIFGCQWLVLLLLCVFLVPYGLLTGLVLHIFGSRPLLTERGGFDLDGTPVRYQVFSLQFPSGRQPKWLTRFVCRYTLDLLPLLTSGLRGWLSPTAVGRLWWSLPRRGFERWP
ncbi:MAG: hypothetical protein EBS05_16230 [Proteobacteria bacterium]|nr:hypothetical protein [Pseudomonadota bacterium]